MQIKEAIILAGGLGTRLQSELEDIPKPMAPINQKPFLHYLFQYLSENNVQRVILCVGYLHRVIQDYFGAKYQNMEVLYAVEEELLGTGGAIKKACALLKGDEAFVLNGDTFFNLNLNAFTEQYFVDRADVLMALKKMDEANRYGVVRFKGNKVIGFNAVAESTNVWVNGGVYILQKQWFENLDLPEKFSFEKDVLEKQLANIHIAPHLSSNYFIDIGIPTDYKKAQLEVPKMFSTLR